MSSRKSVTKWTCEDVGVWLQNNGFQEYKDLFCVSHKIDGPALLYITEEDLKNPPLNLTVLGDVKRLTIGITVLRNQTQGYLKHSLGAQAHGNQGLYDVVERSPLAKSSRHRRTSRVSQNCNGHHSPRRKQLHMDVVRPPVQPTFEPEIHKTVISYIYVTIVLFLTAFVMVEVHDRVPDSDKYPPLPDIILDNLPYMPWAFMASELCGVILAIILLAVIIFHKHKFIVLRRLFAILGTVFLLRCVTMFMTSLSVPDHRLGCAGKMYGDWNIKLWRALEIFSGFGMTLTGVRTCGDYMFSGHTIVITTLNHFITEYTPRNFHLLHTLSWILNIFGTFFVLAAHEHYSIDVIIAFYITSRLFLYYHTLANTRAVRHSDERTKVWFPMFAYFESNIDGVVPNEFCWPFPVPGSLEDFLPSYDKDD